MKQLCIKCEKELEKIVVDLFSFNTPIYCNNPLCERYGLVTIIVKEIKDEKPI